MYVYAIYTEESNRCILSPDEVIPIARARAPGSSTGLLLIIFFPNFFRFIINTIHEVFVTDKIYIPHAVVYAPVVGIL